MSYHRKEVDKFLDYDSTKINSRIDIDTMDHNSAEVELQFYDVFDPNDNIIAQTSINVEFNEDGELETSTLDMLNQDPEFFEAVLQQKYDREGEGQKVDLEGAYDEMFMEAVAGRVSEDIEHDIKKTIEYSNTLQELDPVEEGVEIDIEIQQENQITPIAGYESLYHFVQDIDVDGKEFAVAYTISPREDGDHYITPIDDNGNNMNQDVLDAVKESFGSKYDEQKVEDYVNDVFNSQLEEAVKEAFDDELVVYKDNVEYEKEQHIKLAQEAMDKTKQKKSKGFGMSM